MKVASVTHADVDAFHRKISARAPTHANRVLACLSKMFSLAVRWGWRADNPAKGVERNQEQKRHRYLTSAELERLTKALGEFRDQGAANAVRLLLLTGADAANCSPPSGPTSTSTPAAGLSRARRRSRRQLTPSRCRSPRAGC